MGNAGRVLLALALLVAVADLWAAGSLRALGAWWFLLHRDSLQLVQPALERHVAVWLWDPVMLTLLQWPLAAMLALPGAALLLGGWWRR
jgi:hypothetical protein